MVADAVAAVAGARPLVLYAGMAVLVLASALVRWGFGARDHRRLCVVAVAVAFAVGVATDDTSASDAVGGTAVLRSPSATWPWSSARTASAAKIILE